MNGVTITVIGTGSDGFCLSAPGTIAGKTVTISNAQATAFSDSILVDPNFTIDWSFKVTKTGDPPLNLPVGTTCNVLYLSYATPIATSAAKYDPSPFNDCACNTVVYLGCKFGGNGGKASALSAAQVVQNLWNNGFAKNALTNAKGDTLSYYQNYITASKTLPGLLATHDGQCIAWAYLLHDVACAQGVSGVNVVSTPVESPKMAPAQLQDFVKFIEPYEQVMVKDWNFAQATIPVPVPIPQTRGPAVWQIVNVAPVRAKIATVLWVWNYETDPWQTGGVHWVRPTPAQQALIATTYPYANLVGPNGYTQAGGTGYNFAPARLGRNRSTRDTGQRDFEPRVNFPRPLVLRILRSQRRGDGDELPVRSQLWRNRAFRRRQLAEPKIEYADVPRAGSFQLDCRVLPFSQG